MKILQCAVLLMSIVVVTACSSEKPAKAGDVVPGLPVKNTVTLVELGALTCMPCRMMMPIIDELEKEYKGRAEVRFINVGQEPDKAEAFKVSMIPTQILYDRSGREVFRHSGFIEKALLAEELQKQLTVQR